MNMRYPRTESFFLKSVDNKQIHCYWIPAQTGEEDDEMEPQSVNNLRGPVMIFCGPNGQFAE